MRRTHILWILLIVLMSGTASAKIYKWVDTDGKIHFSSSPPVEGSAEIVTPKPNVVKGRKLPETSREPGDDRPKAQKKVVMYSAAWCVVCKDARKFFKKNKIKYKEYDIETSQKGRRDYKRLKGQTVPIIMIGEIRLNSFDPKKFMAIFNS